MRGDQRAKLIIQVVESLYVKMALFIAVPNAAHYGDLRITSQLQCTLCARGNEEYGRLSARGVVNASRPFNDSVYIRWGWGLPAKHSSKRKRGFAEPAR